MTHAPVAAFVWRSEHVVAVDKPSGMLTIPGRRGASDPRPCLVHAVAAALPGKIWIVHRLDREASGLVLFARSAEAHRVLCRAFETRSIRKTYEAWTEGVPPDPSDEPLVWESSLVRGRRRVFESASGKPSRTIARPVGPVPWRDEDLLRWELRPETGRPHQIRCHAASRGWPIAGDALYGSRIDFGRDRIALRAVALDLSGLAPDDRSRLGIPVELEVASGAAEWAGPQPGGPDPRAGNPVTTRLARHRGPGVRFPARSHADSIRRGIPRRGDPTR